MNRIEETTGASTVCVHSFETRSVSRLHSQTSAGHEAIAFT